MKSVPKRFLCFYCMLFLLGFPMTAHAYLDPGTGSMLLSALLGIVATLFFLVKSLYYKSSSLWYRLTGRTIKLEEKYGLVFYSEGKQYWNTFKPVIEALARKGVPALYLSSDPEDPGLAFDSPHIHTRQLQAGNRTFTTLNLLEADVCVMTTPGLDVLQIRRSPGVSHYSHLVHSMTDMAIYKLYSFDYFDSILCAGPHQMRSLRALEALRGTAAKELFASGCPYMDVLAEGLATSQNSQRKPDDACRVLLAPTWGRNGLLSRFGMELLRPLAQSGIDLTLRPHPQSTVSEPELLQSLREILAEYPNVHWDSEASPFASLTNADVLISDLSGIVFDCAFIFEKPVITVQFTPDLRGLDGIDLPHPIWELEILEKLGACLPPEDIAKLPETIATLPEAESFAKNMQKLRAESLYNYQRSGEIIAEQLIAIQNRVRGLAA